VLLPARNKLLEEIILSNGTHEVGGFGGDCGKSKKNQTLFASRTKKGKPGEKRAKISPLTLVDD